MAELESLEVEVEVELETPARPYTTFDSGVPATSDQYSLTVGPGGPILLQDTYVVQKMQQFNRERVPERVVHAKGGGAFGVFEVTDDVSEFTKAVVFQPGTQTDMVARFSTVAGERGAADTQRDRGTPRTGRNMNGYTSHTYMWINAGGERFWVKYHFETDQGHEHFTPEEADAVAGTDPDFHIRDLWTSINRGEYPSWTLYVQVMPFEEAADYRFSPFDVTKIWPHGDYPLIRVGRMTLDRNPQNYFAEIEQAAFEPSNMIPGIGPSPDKMLLGRLFSYHDTHLHRIGTNAQELPVNRPRSPVHSYNRDGFMRYLNPADPTYAPNSYGRPVAQPELFGTDPSWWVAGEIMRSAYEPRRDDHAFIQPG